VSEPETHGRKQLINEKDECLDFLKRKKTRANVCHFLDDAKE
jgi:hypothetical protein